MRTCNAFDEWHYLFDQWNVFERLDGPNATNNELILACLATLIATTCRFCFQCFGFCYEMGNVIVSGHCIAEWFVAVDHKP